MYKLTANTSFGVLNEAHSPIRSIPSALRVTLNGQLQLLMLIERLALAGVRVLSANTDGVTIMWHRDRMDTIATIMSAWQKDTGHELEQAEYTRYCRRDVNTYCALKAEGKVKTKGAFEQAPVGGKTDERIVKEAAMQFLMHGVPIAATVNASNDIRDFIYYQRTKKGDGLFHGETNLGKTARWYRSLSSTAGVRRRNTDGSFACVPNGANATLALTLPTGIPADLDRAHYMREARELVESITKKPKKGWPV
jgi:hypothetical protein